MVVCARKHLEEHSFDSVCSVMFMKKCIECKCFIEFGSKYSFYWGPSGRGRDRDSSPYYVRFTCQDCATARSWLLNEDRNKVFVFETLGDRLSALYTYEGGRDSTIVYDQFRNRQKLAGVYPHSVIVMSSPVVTSPTTFFTVGDVVQASRAAAKAFATGDLIIRPERFGLTHIKGV